MSNDHQQNKKYKREYQLRKTYSAHNKRNDEESGISPPKCTSPKCKPINIILNPNNKKNNCNNKE